MPTTEAQMVGRPLRPRSAACPSAAQGCETVPSGRGSRPLRARISSHEAASCPTWSELPPSGARERRRQVDPDEGPGRHLPPDAGEIFIDGMPVEIERLAPRRSSASASSTRSST